MKTVVVRRLVGIAGILLCASGAAAQDQTRGVGVTSASTERKLALVIGNNAYPEPLQNAVSDARAIAQALRESGFQVDLVLDATLKDFDRAVDRFASSVHEGDVAMFYYSGHGIQLSNENYLVPVDFKAQEETDAKYEAVPAARVVDRLSETGARLNIVVLDACRNNPFRSTRSGTKGLAPMESGRGSLIAYATAPNHTADDNPLGANGLFTSYVLEAMRQPGLGIEQVFSQARQSVYQASNGQQVPWLVSSVIGNFYFSPADGPPSPDPGGRGVLPLRRPTDPKVAITDLLDQYQRAYRAMNVSALMEIFPSFTGKDELQKRFADLKDMAMALGVPDIQMTSPTKAKATVVYSLTYTSKSGKIESTKPVRAEFTLKKSGADWVIESVKFPGASGD
jgi:hypothetical protein